MTTLQIGNDIVDLKTSSPHKRFPDRVLSEKEFTTWKNHDSPDRYLWKAWAAKESAYKILKREREKLIFDHANFIFDEAESTVSYEQKSIPITFEESSDFVYCCNLSDSSEFFHEIRAIEELPIEASYLLDIFEDSEIAAIHSIASLAVRVLAKQMAFEHLNFLPKEVTFVKDMNGSPFMYIVKSRQLFPVSFTHHGRFVAAALPNVEHI